MQVEKYIWQIWNIVIIDSNLIKVYVFIYTQ